MMVGNLKTRIIDFFNRKREEAFTLPEIATAMLIFGVLSAVAVPVFINQQAQMAAASMEASLTTASTVVENEAQANNGIYPNYRPPLFDETADLKDLVYYYSSDQRSYCVEAPAGTDPMMSASNGQVVQTSCPADFSQGGTKPADAPDNSIVPNFGNPAITALSPATQVGRDAGQTVTVTGINFLDGAIVLFGSTEVPTVVANSGSLTFINPGYSSYTTVPVQIINPNSRSSEIVQFEFINPILGTTATTPTTLTITNKLATSATVTATPITCPFGATPTYAFRMTQNGTTVNPAGITPWKDVTNRDLAGFSTSNSFTYQITNEGQQITVEAQARCLLEGLTGNASSWGATTQYIHPINTPVKPANVPTASAPIVIINQNLTMTMPAYTQCPAGTVVDKYKLYENAITPAGATVVRRDLNAANTATWNVGGTVRKINFAYSVTCKSNWAVSGEGVKSSNSADVQIVATPDQPAAPTGLWTSVGYDNSWMYWNPVSCNFGVPQYRFVWTGNASGATGWMANTTQVQIGHAQGTYYTWRVDARCVFNVSGVDYISPEANSGSVGFTSYVYNPGAVWSIWNDGWGTYWWNAGVGCGNGTYTQYYGVQTRHGNSWGWWGTWGWSAASGSPGSGLALYNQGYPIHVRVGTRCVGPNRISGEVWTGEHGWTANLNHDGVHEGLKAWRQTGFFTVWCPSGAWGANGHMATWILNWSRAAGWDWFWGDHTNGTFGGRGWGWFSTAGRATCNTSWRQTGYKEGGSNANNSWWHHTWV